MVAKKLARRQAAEQIAHGWLRSRWHENKGEKSRWQRLQGKKKYALESAQLQSHHHLH
jgi:hypothetical protein